MIAPNGDDHDHVREIARGLAAAVAAAVDAARAPEGGTRTTAWGAATGVAELLELSGLAALLNACEAHLDAPPRAVANVLERIMRLAAETEALGDLAPFTAADRELNALAAVLSEQEWVAPTAHEPTPESVQSLSDLLEDFKLDDAAVIAGAQLTLPVAAGLRAALDWLGADMGGPLRVSVHDAALTLAVRVTQESGLAPAGGVLGLMSGALMPESDGRWALRVPLHTERPAYLLARQGSLQLALPWHAVARLRIVDDAARSVMTEPSLEPWSPLARAQGERPAALLALGLTRAWLHLDHIVWRVFAMPEPGHAPSTVPGGRLFVRTDEGDVYWVVDTGEALRGMPQLHTPPTRPRTRPGAEASAVPPVPVVQEPAIERVISAAAASAAPESPALFVLTTEHVRPLTRPPELDARDATPLASPPAPREPAVVTPASRPRQALIVDDSLVARMGLARVLEREGWVVEEVERAEQMWPMLKAAQWTLVFVDVALPDASGRTHLRALVAQQLAASHRFEVIALTRDSAEQRLAGESGITRTLRKPFAQGAIEGLLRNLPVPRAGA